MTFPLPSSLYATWVRGTYIYLRKDVYYVFVLDTLETSQLFNHCQRQSNGRCLRGMLYILSTPLCKLKVYFVVIHIGVGYLGVARTGELGNAKALSSGTSNRYRFPRFFFLYGVILVYYEPSGSGESAGKILMDFLCFTILWKVTLFVLRRMGKL